MVRGAITVDLDDQPTLLAAGEALYVPIERAAPAAQRPATSRPTWSSTSARWRRGPELGHVDTELRRAAGRVVTGRRTVVTGVGVVAPGGASRDAFWETITAGRTATRRISFFDPSAFRSQIAAECDFDPVAAGLTDAERRRADRYVQFALACRRRGAWPTRGLDARPTPTGTAAGVVLGTAVGGTMALEDGVRRGQRPRPASGWSTPRYARPVPLPGAGAQQPGRRGGAAGTGARPGAVVSTGCTSGIDAIGYAHQLIQDGEADIVHRRRRRRRRSRRSPWPASTRSRPPRPTTTTRRTPRGPFDARPGRVRDGRGRRRCWCSRSSSTPGGGARTSTARSPATPAAATPST